jgi:hypothetical protein
MEATHCRSMHGMSVIFPILRIPASLYSQKTSLLASGRKRDSSMELLEWKDEFYIFVKTLNPT